MNNHGKPLSIVTWLIAPDHERALKAPMQTNRVPVAKFRNVIITNTINGAVMDTWMVFIERVPLDGVRANPIWSYIASAVDQSEAWSAARRYCYSLYKVDIAEFQLPF